MGQLLQPQLIILRLPLYSENSRKNIGGLLIKFVSVGEIGSAEIEHTCRIVDGILKHPVTVRKAHKCKAV